MPSSTHPDSWLGPHEEVLARLMKELGGDRGVCEDLIKRLAELHPDLRKEFAEWWTSGKLDEEHQFRGWSIKRIMAEVGAKSVPRAFAWLDLHYKSPPPGRGPSALELGKLRRRAMGRLLGSKKED